MLKCQKSKTKAFKHEEKKEYLKTNLPTKTPSKPHEKGISQKKSCNFVTTTWLAI